MDFCQENEPDGVFTDSYKEPRHRGGLTLSSSGNRTRKTVFKLYFYQRDAVSTAVVSTAVAVDLDVRRMDATRPKLTSTLMVSDRSRAPRMISKEPIKNRNTASAIALYGTAGGLFLNWKALKY